MSLLLQTSLIVVLATATACAGRSRETVVEPTESAAVQVQNQGFSDMVVYAISGGQRIRLGLATGNSTHTFTIPRHLIRGRRHSVSS
jgi:ABC-type taurine transport system ATPase subunit